MATPIPEAWRKNVICILRKHDNRLIQWTLPARSRWDTDTFGNAFECDAYDAMIAALQSDDIAGNETNSYEGQLATYEFLFGFRGRQMYGKIALLADGLKILILSAHKAQRSTL